MARLISALVRHGAYHQLANTPSAHQPFPLTEEGEAQARAAVSELNDVSERNGWSMVASIDSSRLLRGWQSARLIADQLQMLGLSEARVESFDALAERSVGSAANLTTDQIVRIVREDPRYPDPPEDWKANSEYCLPLQGAESLLQAGERVASHLAQRMRALRHEVHTDSVKLFVGHGAAFRHAAFHLGVLEYRQVARLSMHHARPIFLEYLDDGSWQHVAGEWKVRGADSQFLD